MTELDKTVRRKLKFQSLKFYEIVFNATAVMLMRCVGMPVVEGIGDCLEKFVFFIIDCRCTWDSMQGT